jgi:3-oxoacyl-[acyl-carrier protein] reductase
MFELTDRIALVTGASRGLGKGIALSLARAGAYVIINYLQSSYEAETVVETIRQGGGDAAAIQADVSKEADVKRMFNEIADKFGCIEILVNNAGTQTPNFPRIPVPPSFLEDKKPSLSKTRYSPAH